MACSAARQNKDIQLKSHVLRSTAGVLKVLRRGYSLRQNSDNRAPANPPESNLNLLTFLSNFDLGILERHFPEFLGL